MLPGTVALVCAGLWPTPNTATASITAAAWKGLICMTVCRKSRVRGHNSAIRSTLMSGRRSPTASSSTKRQDGHRRSRFLRPPTKARLLSVIAKYRPRTCRRDGGLARLRHSVWIRLIEDGRCWRRDVIQPGASDSTAHVAASRSAATSGGQRVRCRCCREHDSGEDNHHIA
jgi:hypothetical protein